MADQLQDVTAEAVEQLLEEIERYLAAIDAFRAEGAEPTWAEDEALPEWWLAEHLLDGASEQIEAAV